MPLDEMIEVHPLDPYKRVDIRKSSRPIRVEVDSVMVAESSWAMHLYETGLPVRYYLPQTSVKWKCLRPSETTTACPYKGVANYFDIFVNDEMKKDLVWWYRTSPVETAAMRKMVCAFNESSAVLTDKALLLQRESRHLPRWCETR